MRIVFYFFCSKISEWRIKIAKICPLSQGPLKCCNVEETRTIMSGSKRLTKLKCFKQPAEG